MIKTLTKHGNSWALIIDKPILELLQMDPKEPLELTTDGNELRIRSVEKVVEDPKKRRERILRIAESIMDDHEETFRKLAE